MRRTSFEDVNCSVAQCLEVIGDWWTMIVIRDVFMGINRFDELQARTGISRNVLGERLTRLVDDGVLKKVPYQDHPVRYDYRLTDKGRDLWLVLTAMRQWGDRWAAPNGAPVELVHLGCDHRTEVVASCSHCGERIGPRDVRAVAGPGNDGSLIPQREAAAQTGSVPVA
jgi:DNA-binding HxlR family transcriptional regulator